MAKFKDFFRPDGGIPLTSTNTLDSDHSANSLPSARKPLPRDRHIWNPVRQEPQSRNAIAWSRACALGHMCCPPHVYPKGWGPGSQYTCPICTLEWQAFGLMNRSDEYRPYVDGTEMLYGPKYWKCVVFNTNMKTPSGDGIAPLKLQEALYDWRDPGEVVAEQMEELISLVRSRGA